LSNGGSFSATFTGHAGDISRLLTGSAPSDIGSISKTTNGALDGVTASYAFGQDKAAGHVTDMLAQQQRAQREADFEAYRQWTAAHEGLVEPLDEVLKMHPLIGAANTAATCMSGNCTGTDVVFGEAAMIPGAKLLGGAAKEVPALRAAYESEVKSLEDVGLNALAAGQSKEETARMLHQMRRDIGEEFKNQTPSAKLEEIYSRNLQKYGDKLGPSVEWLRAQGKTWDQIIDSASRPGGQDLGF
jgi:hypothetical protein